METLPYPAVEHVDDKIDLVSGLVDELRLYPTPDEFWLSIRGLIRMQRETPLGDLYKGAANGIAYHYSRYHGIEEQQPIYADMFFVGGILGLHLASANLPVGIASRIHTYTENSYSEDQDGKEDAFECLNWLEDLDQAGFDPGDQEYIESAAKLYGPERDNDHIKFFSLGFRYGVISTVNICELYFPEGEAA